MTGLRRFRGKLPLLLHAEVDCDRHFRLSGDSSPLHLEYHPMTFQGNESFPSNLGAVAPVTAGRQAVMPRRVISAKTAKAMASRASDGTPTSSDCRIGTGAISAAIR